MRYEKLMLKINYGFFFCDCSILLTTTFVPQTSSSDEFIVCGCGL